MDCKLTLPVQAVMHLLVNFSRESVQNRLVASLYRENMFDELLYEDENLTSERNRIKGLLDACVFLSTASRGVNGPC